MAVVLHFKLSSLLVILLVYSKMLKQQKSRQHCLQSLIPYYILLLKNNTRPAFYINFLLYTVEHKKYRYITIYPLLTYISRPAE